MYKIIFVLIAVPVILFAQTDTVSGSQEDPWLTTAVKSWIKISGEAGTYGELYSMKGSSSRRPSSTGRIFFRPVLTMFDNFNLAFDLFLSTEGNSAKQQMDQFGLHPAWSWGTAHIGDFSHEFSRYSLGGINIRGAGVEINPGLFRLHIVGGQTQRAVEGNPYESAYARYLFGVKLGIGRKDESHFDINFIQARDDVGSVSRDRFMTIQKDSVFHDSVYLPKIDTIYSGVTPQENLLAGVNFVLKLFEGKIQFRGEASGSAYTKDMYSTEFKSDKIPDFATKVFRPRLSSNVDYAYQAELFYQERFVNARVGYRMIGPGYTSLGLASVINDKRIIDAAVGLNLLQGKVIMMTTFSNQADNVVNQKLYTSNRNDFSITTGVRPTKDIMLTLNFVTSGLKNNATNDTLKLNNTNNSYSISGTYQFPMFGLNHNIITNYSYQTYIDKNILRQGSDVNAHNFMLNLTSMLGQTWNFSVGMQLNSVNIQSQGSTNILGLSARVTNKMFSNRLNTSLSYGLSSSTVSLSNSIQLQSMFSFDKSNSIVFNLRTTIFRGKSPIDYKFTENLASLGYTYRF